MAVLNGFGEVIFQSRPLPDNLPGDKESAGAEDGSRRTVDLINRLNRLKKIGYIALSRKDESGTIILALDRDSLRYWGTRVYVEKAMEKLGGGTGRRLSCDPRDQKALRLGDVGEAENGERAVQMVREGHYDLPFLDYKMPGMDGMQVLQSVKGINLEIDIASSPLTVRSKRLWTR